MKSLENAKLSTLLLHAGYDPDSSLGSSTVPIYQTAAYNFRDT